MKTKKVGTFKTPGCRKKPVKWWQANALATPKPRQPDEIMPDGARQKFAGSIWFPWPKIGRKIEGSWPDWARQHQIQSLFVNKVKFWRCLVQSGQLPSSFLQTFGPGSQTEPATFSSGSVWHDFVWLSGLGVANPSSWQSWNCLLCQILLTLAKICLKIYGKN